MMMGFDRNKFLHCSLNNTVFYEMLCIRLLILKAVRLSCDAFCRRKHYANDRGFCGAQADSHHAEPHMLHRFWKNAQIDTTIRGRIYPHPIRPSIQRYIPQCLGILQCLRFGTLNLTSSSSSSTLSQMIRPSISRRSVGLTLITKSCVVALCFLRPVEGAL